jgi:hypothetical protein
MNTYTLIRKDGSKLPVPYTVINSVEHVTGHFTRGELDTGHDENAMFFQPTLQIIEKARQIVGPLTGDSGYRSRAKQEIIYNEYIADCKAKGVKPVPGKVAKPGNSPHETGAAVDLAIPEGYQPEEFAKLLQKISVDLGFPVARVGWKDYLGQNFVHVDEVFLLFKPYTNVPNPFPTAWISGITW